MFILIAYTCIILIWSTTPLAIQWSGQIDWFFGIAARIIISAGLILPFILWFSKQPISFKKQDVVIYFAAAIGMLLGMTPIYYAAQSMPSGWISLIFGLTPIFTGMIAGVLFKHRLTFVQLFSLSLSLIGLWIIFSPSLKFNDEHNLIIGVGFALFGSFAHSLSTVLVKHLNKGTPPSHIVFGTLWISSLVYIIVKPELLYTWPSLNHQAWLAIVYLGVFGSLLGFILYYAVLEKMDAVRIALIPLITPVMALIIGHQFNNEPLNTQIWLGASLVICGLFIFEFGHRFWSKQPVQTIVTESPKQKPNTLS